VTGRWRSVNPPSVRLFVGWAVVIVALSLGAKYCPWLVRLIILFWRGAWTPIPAPKVTYRAAVRAGDVTYVAGDGGTLLRFTTTGLSAPVPVVVPLGTTCTLRGLFTRGSEVWVVGSDGGRAAVWRLGTGGTFRWGECP